MAYSHISLYKNGAVSPLIYTPNLLPIRQQQPPTTPGIENMFPFYSQPGGGIFDFQKQLIDPINAEISGAIKLHQIDLTVAAIGILLIVVAASAIAKPI